MAVSLGQGEWSVRTCELKTEPGIPDANIHIFGGFYASCGGEKKGKAEGKIFSLFYCWSG